MIDVYSDNVTLPTPEMLEVMARVQGEGKPIRNYSADLEELAAEKLGKERAIFMPTATQCNLVALLCQVERSEEAILGAHSHIYESEYGGAAAVGGIMMKTWNEDGIPSPETVQRFCLPDFRYRNGAHPKPALLCLENTHNISGGTVISRSQTKELCSIARKVVRAVHLDGARIWNAAAATGASPKELAESVDTVTISLDKALSAPYGALLCGPASTIEQSSRWRRMLGGFVRKASVMAVAGIFALENMVDRVIEDNCRAAEIGDRLVSLPCLEIDPYPIPSNIIMMNLSGLAIDPTEFVKRLETNYGVRAHIFGRQVVRLAIHRHIGPREADVIVSAISEIVRSSLE